MGIHVVAGKADNKVRFDLDRNSPPLTFGRDRSSSVCLDPFDRGISRIAGSVGFEGGGWWITNLSRTRPLHVVDHSGIALPLPVKRENWPDGRRAIDCPALTVIVIGANFKHAIDVTAPEDELPTSLAITTEPSGATLTNTGTMTQKEREAVVSMVLGYLQPFPAYDPQPRSYEDTAKSLGLPRSTVVKRIEHFRERLIRNGVPGLEGEEDARRSLAEYVLATRLVTMADLAEHRARATSR